MKAMGLKIARADIGEAPPQQWGYPKTVAMEGAQW
jgi:hypothetical protein